MVKVLTVISMESNRLCAFVVDLRPSPSHGQYRARVDISVMAMANVQVDTVEMIDAKDPLPFSWEFSKTLDPLCWDMSRVNSWGVGSEIQVTGVVA